MRMLLSVCSAAILALQSPPAAAASPSIHPVRVLPSGQRVVDLRPAFERRRLRAGRNLVYQDRNLRMVASVRNGRVTSVVGTNISGRPMRVIFNQQGAPVGSRPCLFGINLDQPVGSDLIELPCALVRFLRWIGVTHT